MMPAIMLIQALAMAGLNLFTAYKGGNANTQLAGQLIPVAFSIFGSIDTVSKALKQAQDEGWTDDDSRWGPLFDEAHKAIDAAESLL